MSKKYTIIAQSVKSNEFLIVCAEGATKEEALDNSLVELYETIHGEAPTPDQLTDFEIDGLYLVCAIEGEVKVEWFN